ncbi:hypothetical protein ASA1KI_11040 [Opitutales bacterium ASA1]|nr:hypothetical protein ASA1KI_11040 [Opitutales bacterium ASA1]
MTFGQLHFTNPQVIEPNKIVTGVEAIDDMIEDAWAGQNPNLKLAIQVFWNGNTPLIEGGNPTCTLNVTTTYSNNPGSYTFSLQLVPTEDAGTYLVRVAYSFNLSGGSTTNLSGVVTVGKIIKSNAQHLFPAFFNSNEQRIEIPGGPSNGEWRVWPYTYQVPVFNNEGQVTGTVSETAWVHYWVPTGSFGGGNQGAS